MRLTIVRGLPGSGKTTYTKKHFDCLHLENDMMWVVDGKYEFKPEIYVEQKTHLRYLVREALGFGIDVVVSSTFITAADIDAYRNLAEAYKADFKVIRCSGSFKSTHEVPEVRFQQMAADFEDYPGEEFACSD